MKARLLAPLLLAVACNSDPNAVVTCSDVPDGGCPEDNGASVCDDVTCNAVYACVKGKWVFDRTCPPHPHDAAVLPETSTDSAAAHDVQIDAPPGSWGGPGCVDLEAPDCSLGTALACSGSAGCCDCETLFVCSGGGWVAWGTCGDAGIVQY